MSLGSLAFVIAAITLPLGLAGCDGYPPWTMHSSPNAIALRWYPNTTPGFLADQVAELHCARAGKTAATALDNRDGSAEYAEYRCR